VIQNSLGYEFWPPAHPPPLEEIGRRRRWRRRRKEKEGGEGRGGREGRKRGEERRRRRQSRTGVNTPIQGKCLLLRLSKALVLLAGVLLRIHSRPLYRTFCAERK
jgi:hypothetical protein